MRAFNDGRWLETEVKLADGGNSISWGFALGEFKTKTVMRINENGEWTERGGTSNRRPPTAENDGVKGSPQFPLAIARVLSRGVTEKRRPWVCPIFASRPEFSKIQFLISRTFERGGILPRDIRHF